MTSSQRSVLIVDDDPMILDVFTELLEEENFEVHSAESGNKALKKLQDLTFKIDLVITDIRMPDGDGLFLLEKIKENNNDIPPVVVMSGQLDATGLLGVEDIINKGAHSFYQKPLDINEVLSEITQIIDN